MSGSSGGWSYCVIKIGLDLYYNLGTAPPSKGKEEYTNKCEEASGAVPRVKIGRRQFPSVCIYILVLLPHLVKAKRKIRHYTNKDEEASGAVV